mmetsp:Transcript_1679/g.3498  ORF Transcript_1679/g.3498 Transcript_1679/m.3498 type:complete len:272 (+) Transcript_1679:410-1225(+)
MCIAGAGARIGATGAIPPMNSPLARPLAAPLAGPLSPPLPAPLVYVGNAANVGNAVYTGTGTGAGCLSARACANLTSRAVMPPATARCSCSASMAVIAAAVEAIFTKPAPLHMLALSFIIKTSLTCPKPPKTDSISASTNEGSSPFGKPPTNSLASPGSTASCGTPCFSASPVATDTCSGPSLSETVTAPFRASTQATASAIVENITKPQPLPFPVALSLSNTVCTRPAWEAMRASKSSSVMSLGRRPTKTFTSAMAGAGWTRRVLLSPPP